MAAGIVADVRTSSRYGGSDAVTPTREPPHVADHSRRIGRRAADGTSDCLLARSLAGPDGALRQRFSGRRGHRHAFANYLPEDERTVRTVVRGREPGRG